MKQELNITPVNSNSYCDRCMQLGTNICYECCHNLNHKLLEGQISLQTAQSPLFSNYAGVEIRQVRMRTSTHLLAFHKIKVYHVRVAAM